MKKIYLLLILPLVLLWACEKESEGVSEVKEIPKITLNGKETVYLKVDKLISSLEEVGYVEEGAKSNIGEVKIQNNIPENNVKAGVYFVRYIVSKAGEAVAYKDRKIVIYEEDGILSGIYTTKTKKFLKGKLDEKEGEGEIVISTYKENADGTKIYSCSDLAGGWLETFWEVPTSYANNIQINGSSIEGFATAPFGLMWAIIESNISDPDNITWTISPNGGVFKVEVELTKKKLD